MLDHVAQSGSLLYLLYKVGFRLTLLQSYSQVVEHGIFTRK